MDNLTAAGDYSNGKLITYLGVSQTKITRIMGCKFLTDGVWEKLV